MSHSGTSLRGLDAIPPAALVVVSAAAIAAFAAVSRAVATRQTDHDWSVRNDIQARRTPGGEVAAHISGPLGKEWLHLPVAAGLSAWLWRRGAGLRAVVPAIASATAEGLSRTLDGTPPHRLPPPRHPEPHKESFPSGHALETTAVALTSAYVLARERIAPPSAAFAGATALAVASAAGRLYLDRHWVSDAVAGACLGIALAAGHASLYDAMRNMGDE